MKKFLEDISNVIEPFAEASKRFQPPWWSEDGWPSTHCDVRVKDYWAVETLHTEIKSLIEQEKAEEASVETVPEDVLAKVRKLAEAGVCQMTAQGKHLFLEDILDLIGRDLTKPRKKGRAKSEKV